MHAIGIPSLIDLRDTKPGELIRFQTGFGTAIAVTLGHENRGTLVGILKSFDRPELSYAHVTLKPPLRCFSFGSNWAITVSFDNESYCENRKFTETPGMLHLTKDGIVITFRPHDIMNSHIGYNLNTNTISNTPSAPCAPFARWTIWASAEDVHKVGVGPFLAIDLTDLR